MGAPVSFAIAATGPTRSIQHGIRPGAGDDGYSTVQPNSLSPTADLYGRLQYAYGYFNEALFGGQLPDCVLTLTRRKRTLGYFGADFFASTSEDRAHEISLNPAYFEPRGDEVTLSTLVHEQAHLARHEFGPANRAGGKGSRGYHDRVWAEIMLKIGLHPTDDGTWDGKMTGYSMTHLIIEGGPFDQACQALLASGFEISWRDHFSPVTSVSGNPAADEPDQKPTRAKFTCPSCNQNAWAKYTARLVCGACSRTLIRN